MNTTEKLNAAIQTFKVQRTKENVMNVLFQLMDMAKNDEKVLTPVKIQPRFYKEKADTETLYKVVTVDGERRLHLCYTTPEDAAAGKEEGSLAQLTWKDMLFAVARQPQVDGLAVNPYSCDFVLSKELCEAILKELKFV